MLLKQTFTKKIILIGSDNASSDPYSGYMTIQGSNAQQMIFDCITSV